MVRYFGHQVAATPNPNSGALICDDELQVKKDEDRLMLVREEAATEGPIIQVLDDRLVLDDMISSGVRTLVWPGYYATVHVVAPSVNQLAPLARSFCLLTYARI